MPLPTMCGLGRNCRHAQLVELFHEAGDILVYDLLKLLGDDGLPIPKAHRIRLAVPVWARSRRWPPPVTMP